METPDFDFVIPLSIDGLQESSSPNQYSVSNVSPAKEIPQGVKGKIIVSPFKYFIHSLRQISYTKRSILY